MKNANDIEQLYNRQLLHWEMARLNYKQLDHIELRKIVIEGIPVHIQHNPVRITSVSAKIDKPQNNSCFLCLENLPTEQLHPTCLNGKYHLLVNPYPIFHKHFTIPAVEHMPQRIAGRFQDMLQLAHDFEPFTIFYNGPRCGASAPMHMHFQAAQAGYIPIEQQWKTAQRTTILKHQSGELSLTDNLLRPVFVITATEASDAEQLFNRLYDVLPCGEEGEPMMNILARYETNQYVILLFPRGKHRPDRYYAEGDAQMLISPATVEMGGLFITPRQTDFEHITAQDITDIYTEVSLSHCEIEHITSQLQNNYRQ